MPHASRLVAALGTILFGASLAACSSSAGASGPSVASVNGQAITRTEFDARMEQGPAGRAALNQLIQGMLIDQYAKDSHIDVSSAEVKNKEDEIRAKYPRGQFDMLLKNQNLTEADVDRILREQLILEKAVSSQITVSDADVQAYLAKNHAMLDTGEQVRAKHILVPDLKTADEVESQLKAGKSFEALAGQYSTDPSSKAKGGELGFFAKGQMVPAFQEAAFSQPIGVVGAPVKSPFGYHIIVVEEKKPGVVATMANSGDKIRTQLKQQKEQQQIPLFLQGLRSKAKIDIFDPALKETPPPVPPAGQGGAAPGSAPK
jgi:foldase protein PrsA